MGTDIHGSFFKVSAVTAEYVNSNYEGDRHYLLFAILAGVRNGVGFAGVKTHTPIIPITEDRGLPEWLPEDADEWYGDHSHTYLNINEILDYDWNQTTQRTGLVPIDKYIPNEIPEEYSGGVWGKDVVVSLPNEITETTTHVSTTWNITIGDECDYFLEEIKRLRAEYPNDEIYMVMGFDS
jgi:hypothetical protein